MTLDTGTACPPRLMRTNTRPTFKFASSVEIKRTFVEYPAALACSSSCVSTRMSLIKKRLLLVPQGGNKGWERLFQVGFVESCLTGAYRSCDYEQCWFLLAQVVISSRAILRGAFPRADSNPVSNFPTGVRSPSGVTFTVAFRFRSYS